MSDLSADNRGRPGEVAGQQLLNDPRSPRLDRGREGVEMVPASGAFRGPFTAPAIMG